MLWIILFGEEKATAINNGDKIAIKFEESGRYYNVYENGNIELFVPYVDTTPGVLAQNSNGEYMIESIEDLVVLSARVNGGYSDDNIVIDYLSQYSTTSVVLMCDLDFKSPLSYNDSTTTIYNGYLGVEDDSITLMEALTNIEEYKGFIPIGKESRSFSIGFDGKNHAIRNLYENIEDYAGLFGCINHGTIKNLTVTGEINSTTYAGGILGCCWGEITNCTNYAKVSGASAGGICGHMDGDTTINNCINYGDVIALSGDAGGILAYNIHKTIQFNYCINDGYVSGPCVGGIMGAKTSESVIFNSCLNTVDAKVVSTTTEGQAGGIIGRKTNPVNFYFYNCANLGSVSGYYSGGIFGSVAWWAYDVLSNCLCAGNITGTYVGGLAGRAPGGDTAYNCYYLKSKSVNYSVGDPAEDKISATGITKVTQTEIKALNDYIENDPDEIGTTGWKKWTLDKNGNPTFVD